MKGRGGRLGRWEEEREGTDPVRKAGAAPGAPPDRVQCLELIARLPEELGSQLRNEGEDPGIRYSWNPQPLAERTEAVLPQREAGGKLGQGSQSPSGSTPHMGSSLWFCSHYEAKSLRLRVFRHCPKVMGLGRQERDLCPQRLCSQPFLTKLPRAAEPSLSILLVAPPPEHFPSSYFSQWTYFSVKLPGPLF